MDNIKSEKDIETCITELEKIAEKLSNNNIKIEEAISLYKEGMALIEFAENSLSKYEEEIEIIEN